MSGGGFVFAPLLLSRYFLLLIINRMAQDSLSLGLSDIPPVLLDKNRPWIISSKISKSPLVISFYKAKKFLHLT